MYRFFYCCEEMRRGLVIMFALVCLIGTGCGKQDDQAVQVGAERTELYLDSLAGKRVAMLGNHTSLVNGKWTMENGQWFGEVEMGDHEAGMDAGVGSACGGEGDGLSEEGGEGGLHLFLNAHRVRLELPAVVGGAIVGEIDKCSHLFS